MKKTLSHFLSMGEYEAYLKGWTDGVAHSVNTIPTLDPEQLEDVMQANIAEQRRLKERRFVQYMNDGYGGMGEGDEGVPLNTTDNGA